MPGESLRHKDDDDKSGYIWLTFYIQWVTDTHRCRRRRSLPLTPRFYVVSCRLYNEKYFVHWRGYPMVDVETKRLTDLSDWAYRINACKLLKTNRLDQTTSRL